MIGHRALGEASAMLQGVRKHCQGPCNLSNQRTDQGRTQEKALPDCGLVEGAAVMARE